MMALRAVMMQHLWGRAFALPQQSDSPSILSLLFSRCYSTRGPFEVDQAARSCNMYNVGWLFRRSGRAGRKCAAQAPLAALCIDSRPASASNAAAQGPAASRCRRRWSQASSHRLTSRAPRPAGSVATRHPGSTPHPPPPPALQASCMRRDGADPTAPIAWGCPSGALWVLFDAVAPMLSAA